MASDKSASVKEVIVDPSPSKFLQQAVVVAMVLIVLGILVFVFASVIAGGVIALLGIVLGMSSGLRN